MNTDSLSLNELVKLYAKAKSDLKALPATQRARFYLAAQQRCISTWPRFTSEAKDTCALREYINSLPEPTSLLPAEHRLKSMLIA
jgi:hypothetical protein